MTPSETTSPPKDAGAAPPTGRAAWPVLAVFALIAAAYVASVPGVLLVNPDTAVYMGLGRSLARGHGYRFNFEPYAKYPPVYPLMLAAVYATAGEHIGAMQALGALSGVVALLAACALVKARAGTWPALAVALLAAACSWFQSHAAVHIRPDVPYAMFSLAALWYAERRIRAAPWSWPRWGLVVLLALAALATHLVGVALIAAVAAGAVLAARRTATLRQSLLAAALVAGLGLAAVALWLHLGSRIDNPMANYRKHAGLLPKEQTGQKATLAGRAARRLHEWLVTPLNRKVERPDDDDATEDAGSGQPGTPVSDPLPPAVAVLVALLVVPGLAAGFWRQRSCAEFYLVAYFAATTLAGGPTGGHRYVLPVVPLLLYYGYASLRLLGRALGRLLAGPRGAVVVSRLLVAAAGLYVLGYGIHVRARCRRGASKFSRERREKDRRRVATWAAAAAAVRKHVPPTAIVFPSSGNTWAKLHYFAERRMATILFADVGEQCLRSMLARGAEFFFVDHTNERSMERAPPLLDGYPKVFLPIPDARTEHWSLYRIDRVRLRAAVGALDAGGPPAGGRHEN